MARVARVANYRIRAVPARTGGYLAQPDMRRLIATALELGWSLWAYEAVFEMTEDTDQAELLVETCQPHIPVGCFVRLGEG